MHYFHFMFKEIRIHKTYVRSTTIHEFSRGSKVCISGPSRENPVIVNITRMVLQLNTSQTAPIEFITKPEIAHVFSNK